MIKQVVVEKPFLNYHHLVGESPLFNIKTGALHWICTITKEIHRLFLLPDSHSIDYYTEEQIKQVEKTHQIIEAPHVLGTIQFTKDHNKLIVAAKKGFAIADFSDLSFTYINEFFDQPNLKLNDGIIDPRGNFIIGSMQEKIPVPFQFDNKLTRIDSTTKEIEVIDDSIGMSNGLSFNNAKNKLYYIDTLSFSMWEFDYNLQTGAISNKKCFFKVTDYIPMAEVPAMDGFCMDTSDNFYIAVWGCSKILQINKHKELITEFIFPAQRITCPGFAGVYKNELFVTSASPKLPFPDNIDHDKPDSGGALFRVKVDGVTGIIKDNIWGGSL